MARFHGWRLCPRCGAELDFAQVPARVSCPRCGFIEYANPSPSASALIVDGAGRLLLGRRAFEPNAGLWDAIGGFIEEGEDPFVALAREVREETGLEVEPGDFVGVWTDVYGDGPDAQSTLNLFWEARVVGGEPRPADDVAELAWFARDALPVRDEIAFEGVARAIEAWRDRA
jgi:ADP-ribose pyrophosphatase YjhB (NUDIX family)